MGKFKEENGKSRVGVFLQEYAPDILDLAGDLTGVKGFNKLGQLIDGSPNLTQAQKVAAKDMLQADIAQEQERTLRLKADMSADSWLSKNIRPMTLAYLLIVVTVLAIWDSASGAFKVDDAYITLFTSLLLSVFGFYFVLRSVNQMIINKKK